MSDAIMSFSPLDTVDPIESGPVGSTSIVGYQASRFNVHSVTEDGALILWNTYSNSINKFSPRNRDAVTAILRRGADGPLSGISEYLHLRGFLIDRSIDELRRVRYAFGRQQYRQDTLELILLASEDCNFRCTYCYEKFARGTMRPAVREAIKAMVRDRLPSLRRLSINWFGGEPLYGFRAIEDLGPFFSEMARDHGLLFGSGMTTNGYLLTPDVAERILGWGITDFQITLDGIAEDHDKHRPSRDGRPTFTVIYDNLVALAQRTEDFSVRLRVNFDRANSPRLAEFLNDFSKTFSSDRRFELAFHAVGKWGGDNDANLDTCGHSEQRDIKSALRRRAAELGLTVASELTDIAGPGSQVCYAARPYNFIIGADGKVMKCTVSLDQDDYNVVGNLAATGELIIDDDKMARWTEPAFETDATCASCFMVSTCHGMHCPKVRFDTGQRPCPDIRKNAKQQLVDFMTARTAS